MNNHPININELFSLKGKTAAVIGGGGYLCSEMAKGLALSGASIAVIDMREEKAIKVVKDIKQLYDVEAISIKCNVTNEISLEKAAKKIIQNFSRIDILVNGAGKNSPKPFLDIGLDEWQDVMDSQITGTMLGCKILAPYMISQKSGSIINISSASAGPPLSKAFAYSVAKAGIRNLTMNLAREWAEYNVRVNALRPGFFPTEWNRKNFITEDRERDILKHTPMNRYGNPKELIGATIWLASEASSFVTGAEINVDGGFSCMTI